jgi:hypothetical protein
MRNTIIPPEVAVGVAIVCVIILVIGCAIERSAIRK